MDSRAASGRAPNANASDEIERFLREGEHDQMFTAWPGNHFLECAQKGDIDLRAALFSLEADRIVGISIETTCYVTKEYFDENDPFADFVVHEAAHIFHNCKRERVGLPGTRRREWLLEIDFAKRETFAYACEAYSRILAIAASPAARAKLLEELQEGPMPPG